LNSEDKTKGSTIVPQSESDICDSQGEAIHNETYNGMGSSELMDKC
jgi:hypothetical protein